MITLIRNAQIYAPERLQEEALLLLNDKIAKIGDVEVSALEQLGIEYQVIDAGGNIVVPGFIDPHVHLLGGGGEGGFATRTPEMQVSEIVKAGITTVVGLLGTDGTARHLESLLAKARGLEEEGVSTYMYTGNYDVPTPTILSNVKEDIMMIDKIIGTGEIAISDNRSGQPSLEELAKLVGQTRVGGLLSGKAGVTHFHTGPGKEYLSLLHQLLDHYELPSANLYATHMNRSYELLDDAIKLSRRGAFVDLTADDKTSDFVAYFKKNGGNMKRLTISSDGNGSLPKFDTEGNLTGLGVASPYTLFEQVALTAKSASLSFEEVITLVTANTAEALKLKQKGRIAQSNDADLVILDKDSLELCHVFAKGKQVMRDREVIVKGTFE